MRWLKQLFTRRRRYNEFSESIREHLDEMIADLMDHGMKREESRAHCLSPWVDCVQCSATDWGVLHYAKI
jgi:hypothetical protein